MADRTGQPGVCRGFLKGSCRFGNKCKFSHTKTPGAGTPSRGTTSRLDNGQGSASPRPGSSSNDQAPMGVCRMYWTAGSCNRDFDCTFKHTKGSAAPAGPEATTGNTSKRDADDNPDFFSVEGLAMSSGASSVDHHTLTPVEAHNHMKQFTRNNYHFDKAQHVQGFVRILASINDRNKAWNSNEAQSFLDSIVTGNGIIRIGEVLRFGTVSHCIGHGSVTLPFQRGYFPLLEFLSSDLILKTTLHKNINHLYTVIEHNYDEIQTAVHSCVGGMVAARTWRDTTPNLPPTLQSDLDGALVFKALTTVYLQFLNRFKDSIKNHPDLLDFIQDFAGWFDTWAISVNSNPPQFQDSIVAADPGTRRLVINRLREEIDRLVTIVTRDSNHAKKTTRQPQATRMTAEQRRQARIMQLKYTYDPPGELRPESEGPRHDNDFADISKIRIAPTHQELLCPHPPYLPVFLQDAPHHLPENSMERHLDIQFRLLREELIGPIRTSVVVIDNDITMMQQNAGLPKRRRGELTKLEQVLAKGGGAYKSTGYDSAFFRVYSNATFSPVKAERRDLTVGLELDAPSNGDARNKDAKKRQAYWEHSRLLQSGSLVVLVIILNGNLRVHLGTISSYGKDIAESSKASKERIQVRISFFDPEVELMALQMQRKKATGSTMFLLDNDVMYEASRPFLEQLQTVEPTEIPFARYIAHSGPLENILILPPKYTTAPRFSFKLSSLAKKGVNAQQVRDLNMRQPGAVELARKQLLEYSELDPSQVEAVINTITRELSLIQGPPGTGKSYTGRKLLQLLVASGVRPIILIAYTNHALDHMLTGVLDDGITQKLVRLGSRSSDERIAEYTLDKLEKIAGRNNLNRSIGRQYGVMKALEEEMSKVMQSIQEPTLSASDIQNYLEIHYPEHADSLFAPPFWVQALTERHWMDEEEHGEWKTAGEERKAQAENSLARTMYGFWKDCIDIQYITPQVLTPGQPPQVSPAIQELFFELGYGTNLPPVPMTTRSSDTLLNIPAMWSMSPLERTMLANAWEDVMRTLAYDTNLEQYERLRTSYRDACKEWQDIRDENRRRLLSEVDIIGCTTTGAAKLTSLLTSIEPRVLMVEEAGQVLEAHILTSLVNSVHHLICIGDPEQLRPTLATFALSMDSERGRELFKFDRSLMERLADGHLPMTQINVQRRMRPDISHFIRQILYPKLEDHALVTQYPHVQGMQQDVVFLNHTHAENSAEDSSSKFNMYEVEMVRDLVLYFLRQGEYSGPGDIAVLCAYLGQLQKVRQALRDLKIAVAVDERDEQQLAHQGLDEEVNFEQVVVAKHVSLGTVDIFQGREAKIVIASLVRNTGTFETDSAPIGFLKSSNRINVALSRAKHGLIVLGNASNLRKNKTWSTVLDEMEVRGQIGPGIPIVCPRHPDQTQVVSNPGELDRFAPGGGCLLPCGTQLPCGHICPSVCHDTRDKHRSTLCDMPCTKIPCSRNHPCKKRCFEDCGDCMFPLYNIPLPCGHVQSQIPCHMLEKLEDVKCTAKVLRRLPRCEHSTTMACHQNPSKHRCMDLCAGILDCCGKTCKSRCSACLDTTIHATTVVTAGPVTRTVHSKHPCERPLYCHHPCGLDCEAEHRCNRSCKKTCRQQCGHQKCQKSCSEPCTPCMEPCMWKCAHHECPVACGSICSRLPCDEPCQNSLQCGHPCPSVCGEPCDIQVCPICLPEDRKRDVVDFIMQRSLEDVDLSSIDVSERLITLACKHVFTVETLDGHCRMSEFYDVDEMGRYLSTKAPPTGYQLPPTCPTCRGAVSSPRYGRVTKRATLDILEQNVASNMSKLLETLNPDMERISDSMAQLKEDAKKVSPDMENTTDPAASREAWFTEASAALPVTFLDISAVQTKHGLASTEARSWNNVVKDIVKVYRRAHTLSTTRGAHNKAYEGALTTLYRLELEAIANDPSRTTETPEPVALEAVMNKIGQPPPKADVRFQIDAYFTLIELRYMLAEICAARIEGLPSTATHEEGVKHRKLWASFATFLYRSCQEDARKALLMAENSSASRQAARCSLYAVRSLFERSRFQAMEDERNLTRPGARITREDRDRLADKVKETKDEMLRAGRNMRGDYIRSRPIATMDDSMQEREWFDQNCGSKIERFKKDLDDLESFIRKGGVYAPLSMQEREMIVKAFDFGYTGHFYTCPNGHPYTITECGGAMQTSRCPECGEAIGGGNHTLLSTNQTAREFEVILQGTGAPRGFF